MMALNNPVVQNNTSNIIELSAFDSATGKYKTGLLYSTSGLVVETSLNGGAWASIGTLVTMTEGTWTSLGFKESSSPGIYQVGAPNANFTTAGNRKYRIRVTSDDTVIGVAEVVAIPAADPYAATLGTSANNAIADALLDRNMATGTDSGSTTVRTPRQALRALRNKVAVSGGTATVYKEDDSTASFTAALTGTPAVTVVDPAGP